VLRIAAHGDFRESVTGPAEISLEIEESVDLDRGDVLGADQTLSFTNQFQADLVWLDDTPGFPGRTYLLRCGHQAVRSTMTRIFGLDDAKKKAGILDHVDANDVVRVNLETHERISLAGFADYSKLGRFVLVDPQSGMTAAAGVVNHVLRRNENLVEYAFDVGTSQRSLLTGRQGRVVWFTGLSGSGKSTLAGAVSAQLTSQGIPHSVLDGDSLRLGLNRDLGFTEPDRIENIRRTAEVAKLMADSGLIVLVSLISPYRADRARARETVGPERFVEVFVDTPLFICEQRDAKGLYAKARRGILPNFTGISASYEPPEKPSVHVDGRASLDSSRNQVVSEIL
jgi:bifunctional enzyme CysN/CysC